MGISHDEKYFEHYICKIYGRLTVLGALNRKDISHHSRRWYLRCLCSCGKTKDILCSSIRHGQSKSCGCKKEISKNYQTPKSHGEAGRDTKTPEYGVWLGLKRRCCSRKDTSYARYGGRGIKVCDRWLESYKNFLEDMGRRPSYEYSIERVDNDGDYCPENCRWATRAEQLRNKSTSKLLAYGGETLCMSEWARKLGITRTALASRLDNWPIERVMTEPNSSTRKRHTPEFKEIVHEPIGVSVGSGPIGC